MVSLKEVADRAGVSTTTVSLVLNSAGSPGRVSVERATRVRAIAREMGYAPNYHGRSMKSGRAEAVAMALDIGFGEDDKHDVESQLVIPYFGNFVGTVEARLRQLGYQLTVVGPDRTRRAPDRALDGLKQRRFDGVIALGQLLDFNSGHFVAEAPELPIVVLDYDNPTRLPVVAQEIEPAVREVVRHLVGLGHRDVLWIGPPGPIGHAHVNERQRTFITELWSAGLRGQAITYPIPGDSPLGVSEYIITPERARLKMAHHLAAGPRKFTAVACYNDLIAVGVCNALLDAGLRIPQDVSVMGFDNWEGRFCHPPLTSVDLHLPDMAKLAVDRLMEMINNPARIPELRGHVDRIRGTLVPRGSTGPVTALPDLS